MEELRFTELCEKHINNTLTEEEKIEFDSFLKNNSRYAEEFDRNYSLFRNLALLNQKKQFQRVFNEADSEIHSASGKKSTKSLYRYLITYAGVAAVAVFSVLGTLYFTNWFSYKNHYRAYSQLGNNINVLTNYQKSLWDALFSSGKTEITITAGTGFAVSPAHIITSYHIVKDFDYVYVSNRNNDTRYNARVIFKDKDSDIAFLEINDSAYIAPDAIPYSFYKKQALLGEPVFTLGFSKPDVVFGEGSVSSLTGYLDDSSSVQVSIPSNPGNSGGPLFNSKGEIVGMLCAKNFEKEGATYAIKSELIINLIDSLNKSSEDINILISKSSSLSGIERHKQVDRLRNYIFKIEAF